MNQQKKRPKSKKSPKNNSSRQPVVVHLQELRSRIIVILSVFIGFIVLGYSVRDWLQKIVIAPIQSPLYYTSPAGGLNFTMKIIFSFALIFSTPLIVYEIIGFIAPVFPENIQKLSLKIVFSSILLLCLGVSFAYCFALPGALHFLHYFASSDIKSLISADEYFSFITLYLTGFALIFQLPLLILTLNILTPIPVSMLLKYQKWVILVSAIAAAIITPTSDIVNMLFLAIPIIALYYVSCGLIWLKNRKKT